MASERQDLCTPPEFLAAVTARFGPIQFDAACTRENAVAPLGYTYPEYDALERDWREELADLTVWCNPRFKDGKHYAEKAAATLGSAGPGYPPRMLLLLPASLDSNWYWNHVAVNALVLMLWPRIQFVGEPTGIDRPLMLAAFGHDIDPGFERWVWREKRKRARKKP